MRNADNMCLSNLYLKDHKPPILIDT